MQKKRIKAMTMVRNDRFLEKWVSYYGGELGLENLYVFFDGTDQKIPAFCAGVNAIAIPKMQGNVVETDRQRARFMS
ncbi:MAG: glycosyltransferase family 2 protein, partial [Muribaculaceae bacterium]|nr:glycosyltransferase family 2 protein [Muribaculaceae bacterium]